jgi:hypothetical protein
LFIRGKYLLVEAMAPAGPGTNTFEIDQNFEPGARNRRLTAVGGSEDVGSRMFDEFDSLDATEKAGVEGALNRCRGLAIQIESELRNKRPTASLTSCCLQTFTPRLSTLPGSLNRKDGRCDHIN